MPYVLYPLNIPELGLRLPRDPHVISYHYRR
jgi:hypothetical protein